MCSSITHVYVILATNTKCETHVHAVLLDENEAKQICKTENEECGIYAYEYSVEILN